MRHSCRQAANIPASSRRGRGIVSAKVERSRRGRSSARGGGDIGARQPVASRAAHDLNIDLLYAILEELLRVDIHAVHHSLHPPSASVFVLFVPVKQIK